MNVHGHGASLWWPQWRSHWQVLHAWPVSAQVAFLTVLTGVMTLWLSWLVSGEAWQTYTQSQEREQVAWEQLQALQTKLDQHRQRMANLQSMAHPSGADWPAWVGLSEGHTAGKSAVPAPDWPQLLAPSGVQVLASEGLAKHHWRGSLPSLLVAWQTWTQYAPQARVTGWVLAPQAVASGDSAPTALTLQLETREDAQQVWQQVSTGNRQSVEVSTPPSAHAPQSLFNPFDTAGLTKALPALPQARSTLQAPDVDLSEWQWVGAASSANQSRALLTHAGALYTVTLGQPLGRDGGEVSQIAPDHVWVREWVIDSLGQWQTRSTRWPPKALP